MDPFSTALAIAQSVATNVITELITGRAHRAQLSQIERSVETAMVRRNADLAELTSVVNELRLLLEGHPHLEIQNGTVMYQPLAGGTTGLSENARLIAELEQLDQLIASRRRERISDLGASTGTQVESSAEVADYDSQDISKPDASGTWSHEIARMRDEIRRRREGGE